MGLINRLIVAIDEAGLRNDAYGTINGIASWIAILFGLLHGRKLKVGLIALCISLAIERNLAGPLATAIVFVENGFVNTGAANGVVIFAFVPLTGFLISKLVKKPYKEIWDVLMPVPIVMFAGARIACTVTGCCRGYPCNWGVYNAIVDDYLFPIQLLEGVVAILIIVAVIWREKKNKFIPDGRNVPIILISYGIARFFMEFFHDNTKILLGCSTTSFHCIFMILVGVAALRIISKDEEETQHIQRVVPENYR